MDSKQLFNISEQGYNCAEVDKYIDALKAEYKKVYEYARGVEDNNAKLKKICLALSNENKSLKAGNN